MDSSKAKPTHTRQADIPGTPTPHEARVMFAQNAGMASVLTTEGVMHRDGQFEAPPHLQAFQNMSITGQARPGETPAGKSPLAQY